MTPSSLEQLREPVNALMAENDRRNNGAYREYLNPLFGDRDGEALQLAQTCLEQTEPAQIAETFGQLCRLLLPPRGGQVVENTDSLQAVGEILTTMNTRLATAQASDPIINRAIDHVSRKHDLIMQMNNNSW